MGSRMWWLVALAAAGCAEASPSERSSTEAVSLDSLPQPVDDAALPGTARGCLGGYEHGRVWGWAEIVDRREPVKVRIEVDGSPVAREMARQPRADLRAKGLHPTGEAGFSTVVGPLRPGAQVAAYIEGRDVALHGGPCTVTEQGVSDCTGGKPRGHLGGYADGEVWGWAQVVGRPDPVHVQIRVDDRPITTVLADQDRPDLREARLHPTGSAGFLAEVGAVSNGTRIEAILVESDTPLRGGPLRTVAPAEVDARPVPHRIPASEGRAMRQRPRPTWR